MLKTLLPPNASSLLRDFEKSTALGLSNLDIQIRYLNNPDKCPEHILPWLAWAVSFDVWNDFWQTETKREVIKSSIQVHKQKGTLHALKKALSAFKYANINISEWFDYDGKPFNFKVFVEIIANNSNFGNVEDIYKTIMQTKNVRSHLEALQTFMETKHTSVFSCACFATDTTTIYPRE